MPTYFKPLRRKIGVAVLMIACVLMAGWVRSSYVHDEFTCRFGMRLFGKLISTSDHLIFVMLRVESDKVVSVTWWAPETKASPKQFLLNIAGGIWASQIKDQIFSIDSVEFAFNMTKVSANWFVAPYWSVVIPLTLLSIWLLLSKSKQPKPTPEAPV